MTAIKIKLFEMVKIMKILIFKNYEKIQIMEQNNIIIIFSLQ